MGIGFCFPWQNCLVLEKGKTSSCLNFPFQPAVKAWLLRENLGRGALLWPTSWQVCIESWFSWFSSIFPSHPPTAPSVLPPCPLLQGSCCPLAPTPEPSSSPCPPGPARGGRCLFSCPRGLFPIHFVHIYRDMKHCPGSLGGFSCTSQATSAKSHSRLSPPGPGGCPSPAGTLLQFFVSSFITRVEITASWGLDSRVQWAALQKQNSAENA